MSFSKSIKMDGNSTYLFNSYLDSGKYMFLINAPFDTQIIVSPVNPISGLYFVDQDPTPNIYNALLTVPKTGQYGFKITLNKNVSGEIIDIQIIRQDSSSNNGNNDDSQIECWNRHDVQDFISTWLRNKHLNKWGFPDTPGVIQGTPEAYLQRSWDNIFHYNCWNEELRNAIRERFPNYTCVFRLPK